MVKRIVEIEDELQDWVDGAIEEVRDELELYLDNNPDTEETPDIGNDLDYGGAIHEIVDSAVPIYTNRINDAFYLHGDEIEAAFDDAGIGDKNDEGWPCGWKAAAIYCYIEAEVNKWYSENADEIFDAWKAKRDADQGTDGE